MLPILVKIKHPVLRKEIIYVEDMHESTIEKLGMQYNDEFISKYLFLLLNNIIILMRGGTHEEKGFRLTQHSY